MGTSQPKVVVVEGADPNVVDVGGATVMLPTGSPFVANPEGVTVDICTKARAAPVLLATGAGQCCKDTV